MESEKMLSPRRAFGRAWEDFEPVTEPERKLAEAARAGDLCKFGEIAPETSETANTIRAEFLRFLALGGDDRAPLHERGVRLQGAFIAGELDLEGAELPFYIRLGHCRFSAQIILRGARGRTINLQASRLSGLIGERLKLDGGLLLTNVQVDGPIRLVGARIASDLECKGARFENPDDDALNCSRAKIGGGLFFGETTSIIGKISFAHAQVGTLGDASDCWPEGSLNLDGFIYEHISSRAPLELPQPRSVARQTTEAFSRERKFRASALVSTFQGPSRTGAFFRSGGGGYRPRGSLAQRGLRRPAAIAATLVGDCHRTCGIA